MGRTRAGSRVRMAENTRNKAQIERGAEDEDVKRFADVAQIDTGETWEKAHGHSGTRRSWIVSLTMVASLLLAAGGFTFGPRILLWIGVGCAVALGGYSLIAHVWSDYERDG